MNERSPKASSLLTKVYSLFLDIVPLFSYQLSAIGEVSGRW
ncbi:MULTISPECIES: hypothetical protein [Chroococcidiopsis]|nr:MULTISPECIES: hypothetical protein [Chroococcidiopsis]